MTNSHRPAETPEADRILIVDDQETNILLLENALSREGYRIDAASDGATCIEKVQAAPPDLILLDIMMPGIDGFEVCSRLKAMPESADIPIIVVTALNRPEDYVRAIESGADDFMSKPLNRNVLLARVRGYLRAKALADQVRKLDALKADLTRMIVHDLNSPMFGVLGYLDLMEMDRETPPAALKQVRAAKRSAQEAVRMIRNLLDIEKLESGTLTLQKSVFSLRGLAEESIEGQKPQIEARGVAVRLECENAPCVRADRDLLGRVLQNLLGNALKFCDDGRPIEMRIEHDAESAVLTVANHGPTIALEDQRHIFDKFAQAEKRPEIARKGCGLGLAFSRMVMEAHDGAVSVASPPRDWTDGVEIRIVMPACTVRTQTEGGFEQ